MKNILKLAFNKEQRFVELDGTPVSESTPIGRLFRPWLIGTAILGGIAGTYLEKPNLNTTEMPPYFQALLSLALVTLVKRQALHGMFNRLNNRYVIDKQANNFAGGDGLSDTAPLMLTRSGYLGLTFVYILSGGNHIAFAAPIIADAIYDGYISGRVLLGSWNVIPRKEMPQIKSPQPK